MARILNILEIPLLIAVPVVLALCAYFQVEQSALLTMLVVFAVIMMMFTGFEAGKPSLRQIMPTVVLAALASAGRILFAPIPDFKPVLAICIIAGAVFGKRCGFMVGALAALCSNFFFGQGPWTPWQMYAWGLMGYLAGIAAQHGVFKNKYVVLGFGFVAALAYGFILNSWYIVGYINPITLPAALAAYGAGFAFDCVQGVATIIFLSALYIPWQKKLTRIKTKFDLRS